MVEPSSRTVAQVLGEITWLYSQTATHKHLTLADLEACVMPAILLNQFHIFYKDDKQPIAVAIWAGLSEEQEQLLLAKIATGKTLRLDPKAWRSGERLWLIDIVSPFAMGETKIYDKIFEDMAKGFPGKVLRSVMHEMRAVGSTNAVGNG